jgi:hypothetical protein
MLLTSIPSLTPPRTVTTQEGTQIEVAPFKGNTFFLKTFWIKFIASYGAIKNNNQGLPTLPDNNKWIELWLLKRKKTYSTQYGNYEANTVTGPNGETTTDTLTYSAATYRLQNRPSQFLLDRGAEKPIRNKDAMDIWQVIKYKKLYFKKPNAKEWSTDNDDNQHYTTDWGKQKIFWRLPGMRKITINAFRKERLATTEQAPKNGTDGIIIQMPIPVTANSTAITTNADIIDHTQLQQPLQYTMDENYQYWLYTRWKWPSLTHQMTQLPTYSNWANAFPQLSLQTGSIWWDDN